MKCLVITSVLAAALACTAAAQGDILADWTFETLTIPAGTTGTDYPVSPNHLYADSGVFAATSEARGHHALSATWSSPVGNGSQKSFSSNTWNMGDYYQFQTSAIGYENLTFMWDQTRSSTGPIPFELQWSTNGLTFTPVYSYSLTNESWSSLPPPNPASTRGPIAIPPAANNQPIVYFRLVVMTSAAAGGTSRVDNIIISGTVIPQPTGACCVGSVCIPNLTLSQCLAQPGGGIWKGAGSDCFPNPCVPINYYWDNTTGERGGDGYLGQWIEYPNAPDGLWYNMWWFNGLAMDRVKDVTFIFNINFPLGSGLMDVAMVRSTPNWTNESRPPLADEEPFIEREYLGTINTAGSFTFTRRLPYCPTWVSIDVRGSGFVVQGTITHPCVAIPTGACCVGWDCTIQTQAACAALQGRYQGDGTTCAVNPCVIKDKVVCEPQPPIHPNTYWYDVTPGGNIGRCDFHVRVYDPNPANYTNPSLPGATWQFQVHQVGTEWWASWWDPNCTNAIFGPNATRFQFTNPSDAVWGDWRTTIASTSNPYDVRAIDNSGHHASETDGYGYRVHVPNSAANWFWKDCNDTLANGYLPDFDQRQDFNADGTVEAGYCGPTAVANSIWWFNCKYPAAGIVPANWTAINLIQDLAQRMATNSQTPSPNGHVAPYSGTYYDDMQSGIHSYLTARGVTNLLYEHTELRPTYDFINSQVQISQDVTLLVGFWHVETVVQNPDGSWMVTWKRTGGHYLTVAGVDPLNQRVALSDPDGDFAEHGYTGVVRPPGTDHDHDGDNNPNTTVAFRNGAYNHAVHNTDTHASHDFYSLLPSISPGGVLALVLDGNPLTYGSAMEAYHQDENGGQMDWPMPTHVDEYQMQKLWPNDPNNFVPPTPCQYYTEVEAAVVVSPFEACGPQASTLICKPVVCPVPTEQCLPKRVRHYLPQIVFPWAGTDHLTPTSGYLTLQTPTGETLSYTIQEGPPNSTTVIRGDPVAVGSHREIETELVELQLVAGAGGGGGAVYIRESPTRISHGRVIGADSILTDYPAESFFDVYLEIDIPDLGMTGLHNLDPVHIGDHGISAVPPMGTAFLTPTGWVGVELFTAEGYPTGFRIVDVIHVLPPTYQVIECQCIEPTYCHIQVGDGYSCTGGCPAGFDCVQLGITSVDGTYQEIWCECVPTPVGACCQPSSACAITTQADCPAPGIWHPEWTTCTPNPCPCVLMGDLDANGLINGLDINGFVRCAFGSGAYCPCGDFTHDGVVNANDISGFVAELLLAP